MRDYIISDIRYYLEYLVLTYISTFYLMIKSYHIQLNSSVTSTSNSHIENPSLTHSHCQYRCLSGDILLSGGIWRLPDLQWIDLQWILAKYYRELQDSISNHEP